MTLRHAVVLTSTIRFFRQPQHAQSSAALVFLRENGQPVLRFPPPPPTWTSVYLSGLMKGFPLLSIPIQTKEADVKGTRQCTPHFLFPHSLRKSIRKLFNLNF